MRAERTLLLPALVLAPIGVVAIGHAASRLDSEPPWLLILAFAAIAVLLDDWPQWVGKQMAWASSGPIVVAATVLASPDAAPLVGALVLAPTAMFAVERDSLRAARLVTNASHLAIEGFTIGLLTASLRPPIPGPSIGLVATVLVAQMVALVLSIVVVGLISLYRGGRDGVTEISDIARVLPIREAPLAVVAAAAAASVEVVGPGWALVGTIQIAAISSLPLARARLAAQRTQLITNVDRALSARGLVGEAHRRVERIALSAGRSMSMNENELQQLRYLALSYAMADRFASELARPIDLPEAVRSQTVGFSRVVFYGLAVEDVATSRTARLADLSARLDAYLVPESGVPPMRVSEALECLRSEGADDEELLHLSASAADDSHDRWMPRLAAGLLYTTHRRLTFHLRAAVADIMGALATRRPDLRPHSSLRGPRQAP